MRRTRASGISRLRSSPPRTNATCRAEVETLLRDHFDPHGVAREAVDVIEQYGLDMASSNSLSQAGEDRSFEQIFAGMGLAKDVGATDAPTQFARLGEHRRLLSIERVTIFLGTAADARVNGGLQRAVDKKVIYR